jgi:hypothetical protein
VVSVTDPYGGILGFLDRSVNTMEGIKPKNEHGNVFGRCLTFH